MFFLFNYSVYNRPEEVDELLESLSKSDYNEGFEVVIIEDGSSLKCEELVKKYQSKLTISYYYKDNSGPGDSRNYGMKKLKGLLYYI
jgi:glycosyltransferase involved in cell wall biosynthesis